MARYSRLQEEIRLQALDIGIGDTENMECPACGKSKYYVTRMPEGILYVCHRVSCGIKGFVGSTASDVHKVGARKRQRRKAKPFTKPTAALLPKQQLYFADKFGISMFYTAKNWRWCEEMQRVICPIHNIHGGVIGHNARFYPDLAARELEPDEPKAITYWDDVDHYKADFYITTSTKQIILVEDQPSALRLKCSGYNACALIGTHLHDDVVKALLDANIRDILLILDADAVAKAFSVRKQWALFFDTFRVIPLDGPDIKDMTNAQYSRLLSEV